MMEFLRMNDYELGLARAPDGITVDDDVIASGYGGLYRLEKR